MAQTKLRALQQWCKNRCEGYCDVKITNMTTSWRDGLAFCALIHRFRPDMINFESLCKENVYYNNHLAFSVAEQLGVTALLDAKDMEALQVPDKLSIITYVASLHNYFKDKEKMGGPGIQRCKSQLSIGMKRHPDSEIYEKFEPKRLTPNKEDQSKKTSPTPIKHPSSGDYCVLCKDKVYLIEKHIEDGNLYHRSCFRKSHMSPTSKILTNYSAQKQNPPPTITINSIDKIASKMIMDSSNDDSSAIVNSTRLKGKLFDKKKDQIQKAEEKLKFEKQHVKEMEKEPTIDSRKKSSPMALKAHLKEIDSNTEKSFKNLPRNSVSQFESHANYNSEKNFQNPAYSNTKLHKGSDSRKKEINDLTLSNISAKSDKKEESNSSLDTPMFMKQVSSQTMVDKKLQARMHNKPITNLKADKEEYVVSGLLKSLAGIRHRQNTNCTSSDYECSSPPPTDLSVPNTKLSQNITSISNPSTIKSLSGDNPQNFKNPHVYFNKTKTSFVKSSEKESNVITDNTDFQNKHYSVLNSSSKSEQESSNLMSTISDSSISSFPEKHTRSKAQLPSIQERIQQYSKVATGIEIPPVEQSTNAKKNTNGIQFNKTDIIAPSPKESVPLSTITKNKQNLKLYQEINIEPATIDVPSIEVTTVSSKNKPEIFKVEKPNVLSESTADRSLSHSQEISSLKTGRNHLGNNYLSSPVSGVILTKLHPGHISSPNRDSSNVSSIMSYHDNRVNPIPKPRREKMNLRTETAKENKENPSELKPNTDAYETSRTPSEHQAKEVKTEWQLEAERRIAARKEGYIDPEVKHVNNNKSPQNTTFNNNNNVNINQNVSTVQKKKIPVIRNWTFSISNSLSNQQATSRRDLEKKTYTASEIPLEVVAIDAKLRELELKGRELEDIIRKMPEEIPETLAIKEDEYEEGMTEWFHIINEKNDLVRKEHFLVFHLQEQELLNEQLIIDEELQVLINSPGKRTKKIKKREKELIKKKIALVNKRNIIVETIEENRLRYKEEDQDIQDMLSKKGLLDD